MQQLIARMIAKRWLSLLAIAAVVLLVIVRDEQLISSSVSVDLSQYQYLRRQPRSRISVVTETTIEESPRQVRPIIDASQMHVPATLDLLSQRKLSLNLGGGNCKWQPPTYDVPIDIDFHKTVIAGYPSGDKRMIFVQMEALTGWPAKDEWDFQNLGTSNHPFIKANYPHHEGIWGWGDVGDQVVLMIRNIRRSMVEYHDILWDIGYAKTWEDATLFLDNLYSERPPIEDFLAWRDLRVWDEIHWYGWFIDYYMEGGLMRDIFTHKITTPQHWNMLMMPTIYTRAELDYDLVVGANTVVSPSYDPHCLNDITEGCQPVAVISAENLRDYSKGPSETALIANVLLRDPRMGNYVIDQSTWNCIWTELIQNGKGLKTVYDRPGFVENDYNFSAEMLQEMINELDRLITKYSTSPWNTKTTANKVVSLLSTHRELVQQEFDDVSSGRRALAEKDFFGPEERKKRIKLKLNAGTTSKVDQDGEKDFSRYFFEMDKKLLEIRRLEMRKNLFQKRKEAEEAAKLSESTS